MSSDDDRPLSMRPPRAEDLRLLAAMNRRLIEDEGSRNPMSVEQLRARMERWLTEGWQIRLFVKEDPVVGYALFQLRKDEVRPDNTVIYVRQYYVERERRNRGLGTRAFRLLAEQCFPPGAAVTIDVLASNPAGQRFWSRLGFTPYCTTMEQPAHERE